MIRFQVDGEPTGKGRPRFDPRTKRTYTPKGTMRAEIRIAEQWRAAGAPRLPDGPARLTVTLVLDRPKAHRVKSGALSTAGINAPVPLRKPDVDNVLKLVMDSLNGLAYRDDVQIHTATVQRRWASPVEHAHTLIELAPEAA